MRKPEESKISVVVPTYNSAHTLMRCLLSLKKQADTNYEVIIVNDCSTDNTLEICKNFDFTTFSLSANKGQAVARNYGAHKAAGDIIAFLDSDAEAKPDWLQKYRQLLTTYPDADMICSGYGYSINDSPSALFAFCEAAYRRHKLPLYINSSTSSNCVIYKDVFKKVGGYPEYYVFGNFGAAHRGVATNEDAELGYLLTEKKQKILWCHENTVGHYFRNTWKGYLKQQTAFSRYAVLSIFKFPKMLFAKNIYSGERIAPQLAIAGVTFVAPLILLFGSQYIWTIVMIEAACLVLFYYFHNDYIRYLRNSMSDYNIFQLFFWMGYTRFYWIWGILLGIKDGVCMITCRCLEKFIYNSKTKNM